jgi:spermidine/putrescine transport system ATP-binding protein
VVVMNEGRIEDRGVPEEVYRHPRSRFAAAFMGESTIFRGKVVEKSDRLLVMTPLGKLTVHGEAEEGDEIELAVRPENLKLYGNREAWLHLGRARITDVVFQGGFKRVIAVSDSMPPVQMILRIGTEESVKLREHVEVYCRPADLILLKA